MPFVVEPDFEMQCPVVLLDDPMGVHYILNLKGEVTHYAKVWREDALALAAKFPNYAKQILGDSDATTTLGDRH